MKTLIRLLLVASVLYGTGAHWAAVQGAAWAGMLAVRVRESSWAEAAASTFSGKKPCQVCRVVAKGSTGDQTRTMIRPVPNVDFAFTVAPQKNVALSASTLSVMPLQSSPHVSFRPIVPPPKSVLPA